MMKRTKIIWIGLILVGVFLRIFQFGQIPTALNRDEAALGYNAFAIASKGIDEWGISYPFMFKSFGDYKLPGYIYFLSGFIALFGANDVIIRLPSLLAGLWIIVITHFFVQELTKNKYLSLMAAAAISLQPWAIFYSRMAFEANLGLALFLTGMFWGLKFLNNKKISFLLLFGLFYFAAIFTYNSPLILAPVLIVCLLIYQGAKLRNRVWLSGVMLILSGFAFLLLQPITQQKQGITVFSDPTVTYMQTEGYSQNTSLIHRLWWNRYVYRLRLITENTVKSFSPQFLLVNGGENPWHSVPGKGHLLYLTYGLFIVSIILLLRKHGFKKVLPLFVVVVGSLLPAIITVDAPHATRSLLFLWLIAALSVCGYGKKQFGHMFIAFLLVVEISWWSFLNFVKYPESIELEAWPVGLKQMLMSVKNEYSAGKQIAIVGFNKDDATDDQLYIYPLFYYQVDPLVYHATVEMSPPDAAGLIRVDGFEGVILGEVESSENVIIIERDQYGKFNIK